MVRGGVRTVHRRTGAQAGALPALAASAAAAAAAFWCAIFFFFDVTGAYFLVATALRQRSNAAFMLPNTAVDSWSPGESRACTLSYTGRRQASRGMGARPLHMASGGCARGVPCVVWAESTCTRDDVVGQGTCSSSTKCARCVQCHAVG